MLPHNTEIIIVTTDYCDVTSPMHCIGPCKITAITYRYCIVIVLDFLIFGRPFVKRFALCYQTVVCLSCLSVCDVGVLWPNILMNQDEPWLARWQASATLC